MGEQWEEEDFDNPIDCEHCHELFEGNENFVTKPYRLKCPHCGEFQSAEPDWDYIIEY